MTQTGDEAPMHVLFADLATTLETRWGRHYDAAFEAGYRQGKEESFLAGIEAAAKVADAFGWTGQRRLVDAHEEGGADTADHIATVIRSLKPPKGEGE